VAFRFKAGVKFIGVEMAAAVHDFGEDDMPFLCTPELLFPDILL
jgi:hypothetical protein